MHGCGILSAVRFDRVTATHVCGWLHGAEMGTGSLEGGRFQAVFWGQDDFKKKL